MPLGWVLTSQLGVWFSFMSQRCPNCAIKINPWCSVPFFFFLRIDHLKAVWPGEPRENCQTKLSTLLGRLKGWKFPVSSLGQGRGGIRATAPSGMEQLGSHLDDRGQVLLTVPYLGFLICKMGIVVSVPRKVLTECTVEEITFQFEVTMNLSFL